MTVLIGWLFRVVCGVSCKTFLSTFVRNALKTFAKDFLHIFLYIFIAVHNQERARKIGIVQAAVPIERYLSVIC